MEIAFTVFTATYNREHTLHRVYDSLSQQTFRDFEWLIVDDGSVDGTKDLVNKWINEANFPIRYAYQKNQGKHVAFNHGVRLARGQLFISLDSDDACVPNALETFMENWKNIPAEIRGGFTGVCALALDQFGKMVGNKFPKDVLDSDSLEIVHRYKIFGDKWGFQRTDVLRRNGFPEIRGQSYVPENIVWGRIAKHYKERFINVALLVNYRLETDRNDQLTASPVWKNPQSRIYGHLCALNERIEWFYHDPIFFFKSAVNVGRISYHIGMPLKEQFHQLENHKARILWFIGLPVGRLLYLRDRFRRMRMERSR